MRELIHELIHQCNPRHAQFHKKRCFFFGVSRNFFENVTLVACRKKYFLDFGAFTLVAELPQKERCFNTQEFTRFLSTDVVAASSHAL